MHGAFPRIELIEWLMGWPIGWTDCTPLATGKYREWWHSHGGYLSHVDRWGLLSLERIAAGLIDEYGRENPNGPRKKLDLFGYELLERLRAESRAEADAACEGVPPGAGQSQDADADAVIR